jgi:hypothetical protein
MIKRLSAVLMLGCNNLVIDDFVFCHKIQNIIFDLDSFDDEHYSRIIEFLDNACDLFNYIMSDYNKCVNAISLLYRNYNAFDQKMLNNIQSFLKKHKDCGIWLVLVLKEDLGENNVRR